jgi:peroxiredoxin
VHALKPFIVPALALFVAGTAAAQAPPGLGPADGASLPPTDLARVSVGAAAPDFTLARHGGGTGTLSSYRDRKNVVLIFFRGYWCPYCITQLTELRTLLGADLEASTEILVVSVDDDEETGRTIARVGQDGTAPDFTFLSDPDAAVIGRYGILNPDAGRRAPLPHPATYVIDRRGVIRWLDVQTDYKIRPSNEAIRAALLKLR